MTRENLNGMMFKVVLLSFLLHLEINFHAYKTIDSFINGQRFCNILIDEPGCIIKASSFWFFHNYSPKK